jgi:predicted MPP superfamily phosphohydrolase
MGLQITRVVAKSPKIPSEMDGYSAALLADLHNCALGNDNRTLREALFAENPDVLLIAGDMITESRTGLRISEAQRLLQGLSSAFKIYYACGNHELRWKYKPDARPSFDEFKKSLAGYGITFLENMSVFLERGNDGEMKGCKAGKAAGEADKADVKAGKVDGKTSKADGRTGKADGKTGRAAGKTGKAAGKTGEAAGKTGKAAGIRLTGLDLPPAYYKKRRITPLDAMTIEELAGAAERPYFNVLLAHSPEYFEAYARWGADLTLSGHFHGGIIRLPFIGGVISPYLRLFPKYDKGLYHSYNNESCMVLTAGLGTHTVPRVNNPPELVLITFEHCEEGNAAVSYA